MWLGEGREEHGGRESYKGNDLEGLSLTFLDIVFMFIRSLLQSFL